MRKGRKNGASFYELRCISCGKLAREKETSTRCLVCHHPLDVRYDYAYIRSRLNRYSLKTSPVKALKYLDFYPLLDLDLVVSMNEGGTPLYRCTRLAERMGFRSLYIKNEGANPIGVSQGPWQPRRADQGEGVGREGRLRAIHGEQGGLGLGLSCPLVS